MDKAGLAAKSFSKHHVVFISPRIPSRIRVTDFTYTRELIALGEREAKKHVHKIRA